MYTRAWALGTLDRATKTAAGDLVVLWSASSALHINALQILGVTAAAVVMSLLTSIASAPVGDRGTTSALPGGR